MTSRLVTFRVPPWAAGLCDLVGRLGSWWLRQFLALFSEPVGEWFVGRGRKTLVLAAEQDAIGLQLLTDRGRQLASARIGLADYSPACIDHFLVSQGLARDHVAIGLRLAPEKFFERRLVLPVEAGRSLNKVVVDDLVGKTPFRIEDVYHDHCAIADAASGKITVAQWVTRRKFVEEAVATLGVDVAGLAFVDSRGEDGQHAPPPRIALRREAGARTSWVRNAALALTAGALVLAVIAGGVKYNRQQTVLDGLQARIAVARAKAQEVRAAIDKLQQKQTALLGLRSKKAAGPGLLDIWEEVTRLLPAHSWLTELRLFERPEKQEQGIVIAGFSAAAASLVGIVDRSSMFTDASLTAPVALDAAEERERFAVQAKLKRSGQPGQSR